MFDCDMLCIECDGIMEFWRYGPTFASMNELKLKTDTLVLPRGVRKLIDMVDKRSICFNKLKMEIKYGCT